MLALIVLISFVAANCVCSSEKVYDGYKIYDISVKSEDEFKFLRNLEMTEGDDRELDFLSLHNNLNDVVRLLVKPQQQQYIEDVFRQKKLNFIVALDNLQT
jgi:hypothetical protein